MMTLPAGFDVALLVSDFSGVVLPIIGVVLLVAVASLIARLLRFL
ncbi:MAG: hypothetical protein ACYC2W_03665 [Desulfurivibrionaceae bacterium]